MNQWEEFQQRAHQPQPQGGGQQGGSEKSLRITHGTDAKGEYWWIEPATPGAAQAVFRIGPDGSTYFKVMAPGQSVPAFGASSDAAGNATVFVADASGPVTFTVAQLRALQAAPVPPPVVTGTARPSAP